MARMTARPRLPVRSLIQAKKKTTGRARKAPMAAMALALTRSKPRDLSVSKYQYRWKGGGGKGTGRFRQQRIYR